MDIWQSRVHRRRPPRPDGSAAGSTGPGPSPLRAMAIGPTAAAALCRQRVQGAAIPIGPLCSRGPRRAGSLRHLAAPATRAIAPRGRGRHFGRVLLQLDQRLGPILGRSRPRTRCIWPTVAAAGSRRRTSPSPTAGAAGRRRRAGRAAERRGQPDPGRSPRRRLQRRARRFRHPCRPGPTQSTLAVRARQRAVTAFVDALRGTRRGPRYRRC